MENSWTSLTPRQRAFAAFCGLFVLLCYASTTYFVRSWLLETKETAAARHAARMSADGVETGKTPPDPLPDSGTFARVHVGTYVDRIQDLSVSGSSWTADLYLWFRWNGAPSLDPARNFQIIDGTIESREIATESFGPDGTNYQRCRVTVRMTKFFDTSRFPLEDHMLNLYLEDRGRDGSVLQFAVDSGASNISSRVKVPGFSLTGLAEVAKPHTYRSSYGDPQVADGFRQTFSQYVVGISANRPNYGLYLKLFIALYAAIGIAIASLFIKPTNVDPRFGLSAGAFFGAVANTYLTNSLLPDASGMGLIDFVNAMGLFTIFVVVAESVLSLALFERGDEALSIVIDRMMLALLVVCYTAANIVIPMAAYL